MVVHAPEQTLDVPTAIEPVLGWRVWRLQRRDGQLVLVSATRNDLWPAQQAFHASCWIDHGPQGAPQRDCRCGVYAASTPETLAAANVVSSQTCVIGAIAMWGSVVEHSRGARGKLAYPSRLTLVCGRCLVTGRGAQAPARVREWDDVLTAGCERHTGGFLTTKQASDIQQELLSTYSVELMPMEPLARGFAPRQHDTAETLLWAGRLLAATVFGGRAPTPAALRSRLR